MNSKWHLPTCICWALQHLTKHQKPQGTCLKWGFQSILNKQVLHRTGPTDDVWIEVMDRTQTCKTFSVQWAGTQPRAETLGWGLSEDTVSRDVWPQTTAGFRRIPAPWPRDSSDLCYYSQQHKWFSCQLKVREASWNRKAVNWFKRLGLHMPKSLNLKALAKESLLLNRRLLCLRWGGSGLCTLWPNDNRSKRKGALCFDHLRTWRE